MADWGLNQPVAVVYIQMAIILSLSLSMIPEIAHLNELSHIIEKKKLM